MKMCCSVSATRSGNPKHVAGDCPDWAELVGFGGGLKLFHVFHFLQR
jgi:hypothetical protein